MSPNYGKRTSPTAYSVPDWLLGGQRKRLVLQALAAPDGVRADDLVQRLGVGRGTAFETLRALRDVKAISQMPSGVWVLDTDRPLGDAIDLMLKALKPLDGRAVDAPSRTR
jgi:hypothetical protein